MFPRNHSHVLSVKRRPPFDTNRYYLNAVPSKSLIRIQSVVERLQIIIPDILGSWRRENAHFASSRKRWDEQRRRVRLFEGEVRRWIADDPLEILIWNMMTSLL